jgi:protein SEY1
VPRIWRPSDDVDGLFKSAREEVSPHPTILTQTLHLIPLFSTVTLHATGSPPELDIPAPEDFTPSNFFTLLPPAKQAALTSRFKRASDTVYLEAKNSTISSIARIPPWFYVLLVVLGWNELMVVLRNPVLLVLVVVMVVGGWIVVQLGLVGPMMQIVNAMVQQGVEIAKVRGV